MKHPGNKKSVFSALVWKFGERFGFQLSQFLLQLVLARILDPEHYGQLSLMAIFISLSNVFIQRGFNTALIQNKDVTDDDYSSVFWVTMGIVIAIYTGLFFAAPAIARFYEMPDLVAPFRVICLALFPGALNSIQLAKVSRALDFKHIFLSNITAILVAAAGSITVALLGGGLWALVTQYLLTISVSCLVMWFSVGWRPTFVCHMQRVKVLFAYGWKLLVSGLIDTLYQDLRSLVIGKKYDSGTLGYYNRGKQFPQFIITAINTSVQSVLLPAMSADQDDKTRLKRMMRSSIMLSAFILFPMMAGLAGVAEPLISLMLTDKWLPCLPYLRIYCFTLAFSPVHTCNLQTINAMGRSDIFLKLEIIKKAMGITALVIAVFCFDSPLAIAMTGAVTTLISCFINAYPNKALVNYSYFEQMKDILPSFLMSVAMLGVVLAVELLGLSSFVTMLLQIAVGVVVYFALAAIFRPEPFRLLVQLLRSKLKK